MPSASTWPSTATPCGGAPAVGQRRSAPRRRLVEGLEEGLTLVVAKAIHGLLAREVPPTRIVEIGPALSAATGPRAGAPA